MYVFLDSRFKVVTRGQALQLAPISLSGRGIFETMVYCQGKIYALEKHLQRFFQGKKALNIKTSLSKKVVRELLFQTVSKNKYPQARIRLTLWQHQNMSHFSIVCCPLTFITKKQYILGYKAMVSVYQRDRSRTSHLKTIDYGLFGKAFEEAHKKGFNEAILLNRNGDLAEGSRTNIFLRIGKQFYTPAVHCGCLKGITRTYVLNIMKKRGFTTKIDKIKISQLFKADEAFLTNSVLGIMPLVQVNRRKIGNGKAGTLTMSLLNDYFQQMNW